MERSVFAERLATASSCCREFTASLIVEPLPGNFKYFAELNSSYDKNATASGELLLFPDDREVHGACIGPLAAGEVVALLWRDGHVPEWIDISVWGVAGQETYFKLICCGRFNSNEERLYYHWASWNGQGVAPFGVKGPPYPSRLVPAVLDKQPIEKYSIYESNPDFPFS